jgi:acid phosphatase
MTLTVASTLPLSHLSRRAVLAGAVGLAALPRVAAAVRAPSLDFVLIGDWGRAGAEKQREVGVQMGLKAEALQSRFVVSVGDNFYEDGVTSLTDPQWKDSFEAIYAAPSLQTPWDVILGNHDYIGSVSAQLGYGQISPRWRMPARYWQREELLPDGTKVAFFYIDTSPFLKAYRGTKVRIDDQNTAAQITWLDAALGASQAKWKIVIGHHPIHTVSGGKREGVDLIAQVKPVLLRHGVKIYINGHDHNFQTLERDGIQFITNGAGSATEEPGPAAPGQFSSGAHGFMTANLTAERFGYAFIDETGATLYNGAVML